METCKNNFKITEFKVTGHLTYSLVNRIHGRIKIKQVSFSYLKKQLSLNWLGPLKNAFSLITKLPIIVLIPPFTVRNSVTNS